jgi:8-oxo-dGTP pyrophosphatase MutT (NUDIX family)
LSRLDRLARILASRTPFTVEDPARQRAAVAIIFTPEPDSILLIKRAEREGDRWSGQMAFPGGRWSPGDPDLATTARRETLEETGVDLDPARLLGRLDDTAPRTQALPPIIVSAFVFELDRPARLRLNHEVAAAEWVALDALLAPGVYRGFDYQAGGIQMSFPGYHLGTGVVWGMTERILTPLVDLLRGEGERPAVKAT